MSVGAGVLWFNFDIPWRRGDPVLVLLNIYNQRYSGFFHYDNSKINLRILLKLSKCEDFICCCSSIQVVNYQIWELSVFEGFLCELFGPAESLMTANSSCLDCCPDHKQKQSFCCKGNAIRSANESVSAEQMV